MFQCFKPHSVRRIDLQISWDISEISGYLLLFVRSFSSASVRTVLPLLTDFYVVSGTIVGGKEPLHEVPARDPK